MFWRLLTILIIVSLLCPPALAVPAPTKYYFPNYHPVRQPAEEIYIDQQFGAILERKISPEREQLIVLVQDAHCNYQAQTNIAKILEVLIGDYGIDLVGMEGAVGKHDLSWYENLGTSRAREKVSDIFVRKGLVTGAEYLRITASEQLPFTIYGIEDGHLYVNNFISFRRAWAHSREAGIFIEEMRQAIEKLKEKIYSPELLEFDRQQAAYDQGELDLAEWIKYLSSRVKEDSPYLQSTMLALTMEAIALEEEIDLKRVEQQRAAVVRQLQRELAEDDMEMLVEKSFLFKLGKISAMEFYGYLPITDEDAYPELTEYIKLLKLQAELDSNQLFQELAGLAVVVREGLIRNEDQRQLAELTGKVNILAKLLTLKLTREELAYYKDNQAGFRTEKLIQLVKKELPQKVLSLLPEVDKWLMPAANFYRLALERDQVLLDNLLARMDEGRRQTAVMVTGGFHVSGITKMLKEKGINYLVVAPIISEKEKDNPYHLLMLTDRVQALALPGFLVSDEITELLAMTSWQEEVRADFLRLLTGEMSKRAFKRKWSAKVSVTEEDIEVLERLKGLLRELPQGRLRVEDVDELFFIQRQRPGPAGEAPGAAVPAHWEAMEIEPDSDYYLDGLERDGQRTVRGIKAALSSEGTEPLLPVAGLGAKVDSRLQQGLEKSPTDFREVLERALREAKSYALSLGYTDGQINRQLAAKGNLLTVALLDRSTHLAENHLADGFIGINRLAVKIYQDLIVRYGQAMADGFLQLLLEHELIHELTGEDEAIEPRLAARDAARLVVLAGQNRVIPFQLLHFLQQRGVRVAEEFSYSLQRGVGEAPVTSTEHRWRLIADYLGIAYEELPAWQAANPEQARAIAAKLREVSEKKDEGLALTLKANQAKERFIDEETAGFVEMYHEVNDILRDILEAAGLDPDNFKLYLLDSDEPNAHVLQYGHYIFVNIGLIKFIKENGGSRDALAFCLAHEVRHIPQWLELIVNNETIDWGWGDILLGHGKEYDADQCLPLVDAAGYSVREAQFFFNKMAELYKGRGLNFGFLTHPPNRERALRLGRDILRYFWQRFFQRARPLVASTDRQTRHRAFQARVQACDNLSDLRVLFAEASTPEELIYAINGAYLKLPAGERNAALTQFRVNLFTRFTAGDPAKERVYLLWAQVVTLNLQYDEEHQRRGGFKVALSTTFPPQLSSFYDRVKGDFRLLSLEEIAAIYSVELPRQLMSQGVKRFDYDIYLIAIASSLREKLLSLPATAENLAGVVKLLDLLRLRVADVRKYAGGVPRDIEGVIEDCAVTAFKMMRELAPTTDVSPYLPLGLKFLDLVGSVARYHTGEQTASVVCAFFKEASADDQALVMNWLLRDNAEKSTPLRNYFFAKMVLSPALQDSLPGMGQGAREDLRILFANPYFTRQMVPQTVRVEYGGAFGHENVNIVIRWLAVLTEKYNLDPEQQLDLYLQALEHLQAQPLSSETEEIYEKIRDKLWFGSLREVFLVRVDGDQTIPQDLHLSIKALMYFYRQGLVLEFRTLRKFFFSVPHYANRFGMPRDIPQTDVAAFMEFLSGLKESIQARYPEEKEDEKERRWNSYLLPLAVYAGVDNAALTEAEYDSSRSHPDPRFGQFFGEFKFFYGMGIESLESYQRTSTARGRGINRVQGTGQGAAKLREVFAFIEQSTADFEGVVAELSRLPATVYRNFALFGVFVDKILIAECGLTLDRERIFDLEYLQDEINQLPEALRSRALAALRQITPLLVWDKNIEDLNRKIAGGFMRSLDEQQARELRREHAAEAAGYYPAEFTELGGALAQLDVFAGLLAEEHILSVLNSETTRFEEKLEIILTCFPRSCQTRDRFLVYLVDQNREDLSAAEIEQILPHIYNEGFREEFAVLALEKKREEEPQDFATLQGELAWVLHFFPKLSPTRDDILLQVIDERALTPEDLQQVIPHLLRAPENVAKKTQAQYTFGMDMFIAYLARKPAAEKSEFLLWFLGITEEKPLFIMRYEREYNINFNQLRERLLARQRGHYSNVGDSALEDLLERLLLGEKGIFTDTDAKNDFLRQMFTALLPGQQGGILDAIFTTFFSQADEERSYEIVTALLINYSKLRQETAAVSEARTIRVFMEALGLVGVKLGQILAEMDFISEEIRVELRNLKDQAQPLAKQVAFDLISKVFGNFHDHFVELRAALRSASIKVVYRAKMKDGREVVVKVKRPEVEKKLQADLDFLGSVLADQQVVQALQSEGVVLPAELVERLRAIITEELDFELEADNQRRLAAGLQRRQPGRQRAGHKLHVPNAAQVRENSVMIEEFAPGSGLTAEEKLREQGMDPKKIKELLAEEFLNQIFVDGFFHADPHSGNIIIGPDGKINIIDLGAASEISRYNQGTLLRLLLGLKLGSTRLLARAVKRMTGKALPPGLSGEIKQEVVKAKGNVISKFLRLFQVLEQRGIEINPQLAAVVKFFTAGYYLYENLSVKFILKAVVAILWQRRLAPSLVEAEEAVAEETEDDSQKMSALLTLVQERLPAEEREWLRTEQRLTIEEKLLLVLQKLAARRGVDANALAAVFPLFRAGFLTEQLAVLTGIDQARLEEVFPARQGTVPAQVAERLQFYRQLFADQARADTALDLDVPAGLFPLDFQQGEIVSAGRNEEGEKIEDIQYLSALEAVRADLEELQAPVQEAARQGQPAFLSLPVEMFLQLDRILEDVDENIDILAEDTWRVRLGHHPGLRAFLDFMRRTGLAQVQVGLRVSDQKFIFRGKTYSQRDLVGMIIRASGLPNVVIQDEISDTADAVSLRDDISTQQEVPAENVVIVTGKGFRPDNQAIEDNNLKIFGAARTSALHAVLMFGVYYALADNVFSEGKVADEVIDTLRSLGLSDAQLRKIRSGKLFFTIRLIRISDTLREFQNRRLTIDIAA